MTHSDWSQFPGASLPGPDIVLLLGPLRSSAQNFGHLAQNPHRRRRIRPLALFAFSSTWLADFEQKTKDIYRTGCDSQVDQALILFQRPTNFISFYPAQSRLQLKIIQALQSDETHK